MGVRCGFRKVEGSRGETVWFRVWLYFPVEGVGVELHTLSRPLSPYVSCSLTPLQCPLVCLLSSETTSLLIFIICWTWNVAKGRSYIRLPHPFLYSLICDVIVILLWLLLLLSLSLAIAVVPVYMTVPARVLYFWKALDDPTVTSQERGSRFSCCLGTSEEKRPDG